MEIKASPFSLLIIPRAHPQVTDGTIACPIQK